MTSRKEYEMLFKMNAQLGGSYNSTFKEAQNSIVSMQHEIQGMNKIQADISSYQKQQGAIDTTKRKLEILQQQHDNIQKEIAETGNFSATLENKLLSKQQQIEKTSASLGNQTDKLKQLDSALKEAGVNTYELEKESAGLSSQIESLKNKQEEAAKSAEEFGSTSADAFGVVQEAIVAAGVVKALAEIYEAYVMVTEASIEFESAMTGVDKTVDLTQEEFIAVSDSIKEMASLIPETTTQLGLIGETAGQLGIAKEGLMDFTEIMAMLGTATNMTSDESAIMLAQFASITGMDAYNYSNLGSTIVALGNNFATTERNVADMSQTIAAAGSIAGMSEAEITAISAAVTSLGISSQNGGTQMTKLISDINSAVSSGEDLDAWANVANMSADEFASAWGDDAAQGLDAFIRGLNGAYESGQDVYGILSDLGITETRMVTMTTSLAKSGTRLTDTLNVANSAWTENTALVTEAEKRYATTESLITLKENAYNHLAIAIGDNYTPTLKKLYELEADVINELAKFVEQNPEVVKATTAFIAVIGTATAGIIAYSAAVKIAAMVSAALIPGAGIIMGVSVAFAALTATSVALSEASKAQRDETFDMTAASREQYYELQALNAEYENATSIYGETSYEAMRLRWQVEDLTEEYESGKQTIEEYNVAHEALIKSYDEMTLSHADGSKEIETERKSVMSLVSKLDELTSSTDGATKNQQAIMAIIGKLNESIPELTLSYDDVVNASSGFIDSIYDIAKAQTEQMEIEQKWSEYIDRVGQQDALKSAKELAEQNAQAAKEQYKIAQEAYLEMLRAHPDQYGYTANYMDVQDQQKQLAVYNETLSETTSKYEENETAILSLEEAFESYQSDQDVALEKGENIKLLVEDTTKEIEVLRDAYEEAYNSALTSVQGQYNLWDDAAEIVKTSTKEINSNLEGQIEYWKSYNENMAALGDRSADIQGLSDLITTFADGSNESVNAIAGMASASDEELQKMVENWKDLQAEQETVAGKLADFETEFSQSMDEIQNDLETTIEEMDLSDEAIQSGKDTIQGFIDGANEMFPEVTLAYEQIANAAISAFDDKLEIHSPSRVMWNRAEMTWDGFILSTKQMEPAVAEAMSSQASAGIDAFVMPDAQMIMPQQLQTKAIQRIEAIALDRGNQIMLKIDYSPKYEITEATNAKDFESILRDHEVNFKNVCLDILENANRDARRVSYE